MVSQVLRHHTYSNNVSIMPAQVSAARTVLRNSSLIGYCVAAELP